MSLRHLGIAVGTGFCLAATAALAAPGDLDPTFGEGGLLRAAFLSNHQNAYWDVVAQPDGKIVAAGDRDFGYAGEWILVRYNPDGSLDPTFGLDGRVTTSFVIGGEGLTAITLQPDGKILAAGASGGVVLVARYLPDGALDPSWNLDGRATFTLNQMPLRAFDVAVQADGRVVVAGSEDVGFFDRFAVMRFTADGFRDFSFDGDGLVTTSFPDHARVLGVAIQSDGKIVAAGEAELADGNDHVAIVRYLANGALDPTFHFDGIVTLPEGAGVGDVIMQAPPFERIIARSTDDFLLYRFNLDGSLDLSFGGDGEVAGPSLYNHANAIRITNPGQATSRIVALAETSTDAIGVVQFQWDGTLDLGFGGGDGHVLVNPGPEGGTPYGMDLAPGKIAVAGLVRNPTALWDPLILQFNSDGTVDTSFDGDGMRIDDNGGLVCSAWSIARQPDGKLVLAGSTKSQAGDDDFAVLRCNADGIPDPSFGQNGRVITPIGPARDIANGVAIQSDGKIVVVGDTDQSGNTEVALVRYLADGSFDTSFSGDGIEIVPGEPQVDSGREIAIQSDGKIVVGGSSRIASVGHLAVWRFMSDGALDFLVRTNFGGIGAAANTVLIQPDGKIFAAGAQANVGLQTIACVRLLANGAFDTSFDGDGLLTTTIPGAVASNALASLLLPDGRIVVAGITQDAPPYQDVAVVRYQPNGALDPTFSNDGIATFAWGTEYDHAHAVGMEPNGKLVVAGSMTEGVVADFTLLRLLDDGSLDPTYGTGGKVKVDFDSGSQDAGLAMTIDSEGRAIVAGDAGGVFGMIRVRGDVTTAVHEDVIEAAAGWRLGSPAPNPTAGGTSVALHLGTAGHVALAVFDLRGRLVRTLDAPANARPGSFSIDWDGRDQTGADVASGVYVLRARLGQQVRSRRITVVR